ncbi:hypothetical protein FQN55_007012 [Onygenales sp. PD_40]|nr:hypothetical protein FQN55_007012 [Onygenales sp. PD_40]KAK2803156.1 hypothetical protein FQN51_003900 [Onygenales sp. PD_10]
MLLRLLTLSLCVLGSLALPASDGQAEVARRDAPPLSDAPIAARDVPSALDHPREPWHGKLPEPDRTISRREEKVTGSDVAIRQENQQDNPGNFRRYTGIGLQAFAVANAGVQVFNIVKDCREFGEEATNAFNCVWTSISTVIGFAVLVDRAVTFRGQLADRLSESGWHVPGINKRDEIPQLEDHLSSLLSVDVRHVGIWDGNDEETIALSKRTGGVVKPVARHIFGANFQGREMHFTYMGELNNGSHFRFGNGPGPDTEGNRHRLRSRRIHKYNNQYFDNGGLDFVGLSDSASVNHDAIYMEPQEPEEFNWLVEQVTCYMSDYDILDGSPMESNGLHFQVFNHWDRVTIAMGAIAPFTNTKASVISEMDYIVGINVDERCMSPRPTRPNIGRPID